MNLLTWLKISAALTLFWLGELLLTVILVQNLPTLVGTGIAVFLIIFTSYPVLNWIFELGEQHE